ncbi:MAG: OmpA family protein, partial [Saprospiraceae bacterium]|nr:OmpA family protein [Saprospiraceae bacterium]
MRTVWIIILLILYFLLGYYMCSMQQECCPSEISTTQGTEKIINEAPEKPVVTTPAFTAETGPILFRFNSDDPILGAGYERLRDSLLSSMQADQKLRITGQYFADETNNSSYENLGIARAHAIKMKLWPGESDDKFQFASELVSDREGIRDNPFRSARFDYAVFKETVKEIDNKAIVYFPYNSTRRIDDPDIEKYLRDMADRLAKTTEKVVITGHTCDLGPEASNYHLGMWRAEVVRDYLTKLGVDPGRITVASKGENDPMVPNTSAENRKKNRRAEI